jgi:spermidine/putrescine-binding protein
MNRTFTKFLVLALLAITSFTACKKSANDILIVSKENLAATYTPVTVIIKASGYPDQDRTNDYYTPCEKDDQIILRSDLTATYVDAGTQCTPAGGGSDVWGLNGNTITIAGEDFTIKSLTRGTLVLEQSGDIFGSGFVATAIYTYRRY